MEWGQIAKELGTWGIAVLVGSIGFTELLKRSAAKAKAKVPWWTWRAAPCVLGAIGVTGMVWGGILNKEMALLVWFVVSFAGPILYDTILGSLLKKIGS